MFFKIMVGGKNADRFYVDSYWQDREKAEARIKLMKENLNHTNDDGLFYFILSENFSD